MRQMRRSNEDYREIRRYLSAVLKLRYHETFICSILRDVFFLYLFETTSKGLGEKGCPRNRMERKTRWKNKWKFEGKAMGRMQWSLYSGRVNPFASERDWKKEEAVSGI